MQTVKLSNIFDETQIARITALYNKHGNTPVLHKKLLAMFNAMQPPLTDKGLLPDYAAYLIPYCIEQSNRSVAPRNVALN